MYLYQTFRILLNFFYGDDIPTNDTSLASINHLLKLFASDGPDLLQNYYDQRYEDQVSKMKLKGSFHLMLGIYTQCIGMRSHQF